MYSVALLAAALAVASEPGTWVNPPGGFDGGHRVYEADEADVSLDSSSIKKDGDLVTAYARIDWKQPRENGAAITEFTFLVNCRDGTGAYTKAADYDAEGELIEATSTPVSQASLEPPQARSEEALIQAMCEPPVESIPVEELAGDEDGQVASMDQPRTIADALVCAKKAIPDSTLGSILEAVAADPAVDISTLIPGSLYAKIETDCTDGSNDQAEAVGQALAAHLLMSGHSVALLGVYKIPSSRVPPSWNALTDDEKAVLASTDKGDDQRRMAIAAKLLSSWRPDLAPKLKGALDGNGGLNEDEVRLFQHAVGYAFARAMVEQFESGM